MKPQEWVLIGIVLTGAWFIASASIYALLGPRLSPKARSRWISWLRFPELRGWSWNDAYEVHRQAKSHMNTFVDLPTQPLMVFVWPCGCSKSARMVVTCKDHQGFNGRPPHGHE